VRPVNLIPKEQQRRGSGFAEGRTGYAPYILVGALGLAVLGVAAVVLTSNSVKDKEAKAAQLESDTAAAKAAAEQLRPYGNFAQVEQTRVDTVNSLVDSSFNWERVLRSLSRTIPSNVWLTSLTGSVSADVKLESSEGGSGGGPSQVTSPSVSLVGCTYSHTSVARMMVRMRNLDDVSEVALKSSEKSENTANAAVGDGVGGGGGGGGGGSGDCRTNAKIPKFEILVVIGHDQTQKSATSASAEGAAGSTSPVAAAQGAAATASTPSAGGTP
jgi:Tfp pilus assembly protein PilN